MGEDKLKRVSCSLNKMVKLALEKEVAILKSANYEDRNTINKNIIYIINSFLDKYENDMINFKNTLLTILDLEYSENLSNKKGLLKNLKAGYGNFPLMLSISTSARCDALLDKAKEEINLNITKNTFYNLALLHYYVFNRARIAEEELNFWLMPYFRNRGSSDRDMTKVIKMFKQLMLDKG